MTATSRTLAIVFCLALLASLGCGRSLSRARVAEASIKARTPLMPPRRETLGRCDHFDPERQVFFGDLHVHTRLSLDANLQGTRLSPTDAYRFARGERVGVGPYDIGQRPTRFAQLRRPLDFAAVTDHAEFLGVVGACTDRHSPAYRSRGCRLFRNRPSNAFLILNSYLAGSGGLVREPFLCGDDGETCLHHQAAVWVDLQDATEIAYDHTPGCHFTSLHAYEWSASPALNIRTVANLHRNVVFRNNIVPVLPADYVRASDIETLWDQLDAECLQAGQGCDAISIPHNSNLSAGLMFMPWDDGNEEFTADHARRRARMEPLVEIYQHKGSSECLPGGLTGDEDCGFEQLPFGDLAAAKRDQESDVPRESFVRSALGVGMIVNAEVGTNPFSFGFIASTDTHLGLPGAVAEDAFLGGGGAGEAASAAGDAAFPDRVHFGGGGLAAVWAEENSREGIFSALRRRETYATSGPRITVRTFASWDLGQGWCERSDRVAHAYRQGVPMGGHLLPPESPRPHAVPTLAIMALRDPDGALLQRIQVIKGTLRADGEPQVSVFEVLGDRSLGADLDLQTCQPSHAGLSEACTLFEDPTFEPSQPAYYYVRVLEVPTCRWTTQACVRANYRCDGERAIDEACCAPEVGLHPRSCAAVRCDAEHAADPCCSARTVEPVVQERAWSSPIWYVP